MPAKRRLPQRKTPPGIPEAFLSLLSALPTAPHPWAVPPRVLHTRDNVFSYFAPKKAAAPSPSSDAGGAAKSHGANALFCRHPRSPALTGGCFARSPRNGAWSWPGSLFPRVFPPLRLTLTSFPRGKGALSALSWQSCVTPASSSWVIYVALLVSWPYNAQNGPRELLTQGSRAHKQNWDLNVI